MSRSILFILALLSGPLMAGVSEVGTTAQTFFKLGMGARPASLGEAYVAESSDPGVLAYNPAGVARTRQLSLQATHVEWFQGARMENLAGTFSLGSLGALGAGLTYVGLPPQAGGAVNGVIGSPSATFVDLDSFSPSDMGAVLAYGKRLNEYLDLGIGLKVGSETILGSQALGFSGDLGLIAFWPGTGWNAGLSFQNLGLPVSAGGDSFQLPLLIRTGLGYDSVITPQLDLRVLAELDLPSDNSLAFGIGTELRFRHLVLARLGFRQDGIFNPWSAGLGFFATKDLSLDLTAAPAGELGMTYRGSVTYGYGAPSTLEDAGPLTATLKAITLNPVAQAPGAVWRVEGSGSPVRALKRWALYIYSGSKVIRQIMGDAPLPKTIDWDGKDSAGNPVATGRYPLRLTVRDKANKMAYSMESVVFSVLASVPKLSFDLDLNSKVPGDESKLYVPTAFQIRSDRTQADMLWKLEVLDQDGSLFRSFTGDLKALSIATWDGKSSIGRDLNPNLDYGFRLSLVDAAGRTILQGETLKRRCVLKK
ncbi:MAG: PorV/PorQ family protein [candidate division FCPU426 bacterium]